MDSEMMQRAHIGPAIDPGQNRQSKHVVTGIKRTVSKITYRPAPKGECPHVYRSGK